MDIIVATLISVQWTPEDTSVVQAASTSCGCCGKRLKDKAKPGGHNRNATLKSAYLAQSTKKDTFAHLLNEDILAEVVKKINKYARRAQKSKQGSWGPTKLGQAEVQQWIGGLLWSGLIGFCERPPKQFINLSMKRYLQLISNGYFQDLYPMFFKTVNNISNVFQEMYKLQEKLIFNFGTMFEPGHTLCIEKYKMDFGNQHYPRDLRVALLVDKETGFICNFFIYSVTQVLSTSEYIPLLYIIRKLINPFCNKKYTVQIDRSAHINEAIIVECRKLGIRLEPFDWFGKSANDESNVYVLDWEGYAIFPLNGNDHPSTMFFIYFWLLVHISAINAFTLQSLHNNDSEDLSLEEFVELLSKDMIRTSARSGSSRCDKNNDGDLKTDNSRHTALHKKEPSNGATQRSQPKPRKEKGVTGITNLGNTCYMNSVIQCLSSTTPLIEYFFSWQFENLIVRDKKIFVTAFAKLVANLWFGEAEYVKPEDLWHALCGVHPPFGIQIHHDAQELLIYMLGALHEDLTDTINSQSSNIMGGTLIRHMRRSVPNSPITRLFQGVLSQTTTCMECARRSYKEDIFTMLSLPIPSGNKASLTQCLQGFFQQVMLTQTDKIFCSYCNRKQDVAVEVKIGKPPKILILHLKRFKYQDQVKRKLKTNVIFPLTNLDMAPFVTDHNVKDLKYHLYAVVNHSGELEFGHYTAHCKYPGTREWNTFDDAMHFKITEDKVQSPSGYILFYANQEFCLPHKTSSSSLF